MATARDGDTIILSPGRYDECAVLRQNGLTLEGAGGAAAVVIAGTPCQGKALLVIDGAGITIRTLTLADARVADGNGAGIRAEGGALTVQGVRFLHNQDGILTSDAAPSLVLVVRGSFFQGNGACLAACAHAIYAGHIAALRVQGSLFRDTREGHIIKSRALRTEITGCSLTDGPLGTSSYLIEAPDGGALVVRGNVLEKGPRTGNPDAAIAIGLEGADNPTPAITIEGNRATNDGPRRAALVKNWTATAARFSGNKMTGAWRQVTSR